MVLQSRLFPFKSRPLSDFSGNRFKDGTFSKLDSTDSSSGVTSYSSFIFSLYQLLFFSLSHILMERYLGLYVGKHNSWTQCSFYNDCSNSKPKF